LTSISPTSSIAPLIFVLAVTAIKEAYEDWRRRNSDNEINHRTAWILRDYTPGENLPELEMTTSGKTENTEWKSVYWQDLAVGDIIKIEDGDWVHYYIYYRNDHTRYLQIL
jgi:magnesium-transporting ATPase (P-type)